MAIKEAPVLEQAYSRLVELSADESARMIADAREKARRDASAVKESAYLDGWEGGREEGRADMIRAMLEQGVTLADVARLTKSPLNEVERLAGR